MDLQVARLTFLGKAWSSSDFATLFSDGVALLSPVPGWAECWWGAERVAGVGGDRPPGTRGPEWSSGDLRLQLASSPVSAADRAFLQSLLVVLRAVLEQRDHRESDRRRVHDLRGALAVVSGQGEMLASGIWGELTEPQLRSVEVILRQADRIRKLHER